MASNNIFTTALAAAGIFSHLASAHIVMNTPTPFNLHSGTPLLQVNPLDGGTNPFPCHNANTANSVTTLVAGSTTPVSFTGQAVHGGGSCQFSITYDYPGSATDPAKWKAIYTLIGGCPASAVGNLPAGSPAADAEGRADGPHCGNDSGTECMRTFNVPIPQGLKNGNATFSWSWFNKRGNREMYQNCAPVTVTGGTEDAAFFDSLPPMFVANIPGQCTTGIEGVLNIPNPGKYGRVLEQPNPDTSGACAKADIVPSFEVGSDTSSSSIDSPAPAPPPSDSGSSVQTASTTSSTSAPLSTPPPTPETPNLTPPKTTEINTTTDANNATEVNSAQETSCAVNGAIVCIDSSHFGVCDHGVAVPQLLASGTVCQDGVITRRK